MALKYVSIINCWLVGSVKGASFSVAVRMEHLTLNYKLVDGAATLNSTKEDPEDPEDPYVIEFHGSKAAFGTIVGGEECE